MPEVLVVGDANPDLLLRGDVVPRFGQVEQLLDDARTLLGGSAAITAHGLARLGRSTGLVAAVGQDLFGDLMVELLATASVRTDWVYRRTLVPTGISVVLGAGVDRGILTLPGAIPTLTEAEVCAAVKEAAGLRHVHVSSLFLQPALAGWIGSVLADVRRRGASTSLDTNYDPAQQWAGVDHLLPLLDFLLPNRVEVLALAAAAGHPTHDAVDAAQHLAGRGPTVVLKDGAAGAISVQPDGTVLRQRAPTLDPVDTTGAGDTFDAAFLDSRLRDLSLIDCLRRAVRAGALATQGVGGTAGQPTLAQLIDDQGTL
ncbi:MAG: carbohydrate kinase family protein [Jatrophihabitans sp.]